LLPVSTCLAVSYVLIRVTRLDECSPNGDCFLWTAFLKITKVAHIFGLHFPLVKVINYYDKYAPGYILGDFSQTHLATLVLELVFRL
jgi:hypothetical protein